MPPEVLSALKTASGFNPDFRLQSLIASELPAVKSAFWISHAASVTSGHLLCVLVEDSVEQNFSNDLRRNFH
jgi:hypothetical protein